MKRSDSFREDVLLEELEDMNIPKEDSGICDNLNLEEPFSPDLDQPLIVKPTSVKMVPNERNKKMDIEEKLITLFSKQNFPTDPRQTFSTQDQIDSLCSRRGKNPNLNTPFPFPND